MSPKPQQNLAVSRSYDRHTHRRKSKRQAITPTEYNGWQAAYDFFNMDQFGGSLPHVLVTLHRHSKFQGYFWQHKFNGRTENTAAHELEMNPDAFTGRTDEQILSTLAHEMAHVWQHTHGKPPSPGYHDRQFAAKMQEIGLQPSRTGKPGGKETGQHMSHYILPKGRYARTYAKLKATGFKLQWQSAPRNKADKIKRDSKTKFTCQQCGQNAWAKPDAKLICGECSTHSYDKKYKSALMIAGKD